MQDASLTTAAAAAATAAAAAATGICWTRSTAHKSSSI